MDVCLPGVDPDLATSSFMDGDINTPVQAAADLGHTEVIRLLVTAGAKKLGVRFFRGVLKGSFGSYPPSICCSLLLNIPI